MDWRVGVLLSGLTIEGDRETWIPLRLSQPHTGIVTSMQTNEVAIWCKNFEEEAKNMP
jgi:hypothetical protein